jgi:hypothetical protein
LLQLSLVPASQVLYASIQKISTDHNARIAVLCKF